MVSKAIPHQEQSLRVLEHLAGWGFSTEVQRRLGALTVVWGVFETNLESTLWALTNESVAGVRPSTDKTTISEWLDALGRGTSKFDAAAQELLKLTALAAKDLMEYRHTLVHGWLIPSPSGAQFIRNPRWNGEIRKRPSSDAHVNENLLDMAIDCAWTLCQVVFCVRDALSDPSKVTTVLERRADVLRAKSLADELRHLTALMNHETY